MQTYFNKTLLAQPEVARVDKAIRKCVHCGFCNVTCPTYQLTGDELDGPRGRIYQIKNALEADRASPVLQKHLDRCLTCRSCETTCPAGVDYSHVLDLGREMVNRDVRRPARQRLLHGLLRAVLPERSRFAALLRLGRWLRPILPAALKTRVPLARPTGPLPDSEHSRNMILLEGCVQDSLDGSINGALIRVFDHLGIALKPIAEAGCCGALDHHLAPGDAALNRMRHNIDCWWPEVEQGAEAIVAGASGCGVALADYGRLLLDDPVYGERAAKISALVKDPAEILAAEALDSLPKKTARKVAFQCPCTLQHGFGLSGQVEKILKGLGHILLPVVDGHICCGSAGTYSLLQPKLAEKLRENKISHLNEASPELILTANIGCQMHLQAQSPVPVKHWIELLDPL